MDVVLKLKERRNLATPETAGTSAGGLLFDNVNDTYSFFMAIYRFVINKLVIWTTPAEMFPIVFVLLVIISLTAVIYNTLKLIYTIYLYTFQDWKNRQYYVIPFQIQRKIRMACVVLKILSWFILLYTLLAGLSNYMLTCVLTCIMDCTLDIIIWLFDTMLTHFELNKRSVAALVTPFMRLVFVALVSNFYRRLGLIYSLEELTSLVFLTTKR
ncbi:uncharacterized protein LOC119661890 [Teleopsis dalmanni]|uniref:uncharacterized protein LOC119661890 n=1 Tax=Teleopsis dalmanni TaxID=139649 RepID=UPI0018CE1D22|nr:uncharacterized protein LOC119661890 [Teleopsis dalmanni]